jgi:glycosyltransferase involved in cell wall biosynthesis
MVNVLIITNWKHVDEITGANKAFCSLASALSAHHEVTALALSETGGKPIFSIAPEVHFKNITGCYHIKQNLGHRLLRSLKFSSEARHRYDQQVQDPIWMQKIDPVLQEVKPDVIIAFTPDLARILLIQGKVKQPVILTLRQAADVLLTNLTPEGIEALRKAACIHVLTPDNISRTKKFCDHVAWIPNGIVSSGLTSTLENHLILHSGRFSKNQKRQHLLIEAFHLLQPDFPDWKVEFWGEGDPGRDSYAHDCLELVKKYHLENNIYFCGSTDQMAQQMVRASIFAFPSATEGMSQAMLEAMDIGLPVVGYRSCASVSSVIQDGVNGILCEDGVEPLAEALRKLMKDPELRKHIGSQAQKVREQYAAERSWAKWENLLQEVAKQG